MEVLIANNKKQSNRSKNVIQTSKKYLYKCKICEAPAIYSHFGAISCSSCKMFFKRNAEINRGRLTCDYDANCEININTRHVCSTCRLAKCFNIGMQVELIRCSTLKNNKNKRKKKTTKISHTTDQSQQLSTLNLLQLNHSILTIDQWNLLSNLIHCYDEQSGISVTDRFISQQNTLPFKLRFKCGPVREFVSSVISKAQLIFEKNRDFHSLCSHDRSILLRCQMKYVAIISSSFIAQQSHLFEYPTVYETIETIFQANLMPKDKHTSFSFDIPFLKLALAIISFSTFDYTIYEHLIDIKTITKIQNSYIDLTWRYLIYQYNNQQAIVYFSHLIKYIFTVSNTLILMDNQNNFTDIIDSAIERTKQSFVLS